MSENQENTTAPESKITPPPSPPETGSTVHTWGMLCHLAALAVFIGIPFGNIIGPLVIWLIKREEHPFIDEQGKASLNFQISLLIYSIVPFLLVFIIVGIPLMIALGIFDLVCVIKASVKANKGESFKYPLAIRFFK